MLGAKKYSVMPGSIKQLDTLSIAGINLQVPKAKSKCSTGVAVNMPAHRNVGKAKTEK